MKKLDHPNLVALYEVLDDPAEDSLYMVLELCQKGVVMQVGIDERADAYDDERCRTLFRDLILAVEYRTLIPPWGRPARPSGGLGPDPTRGSRDGHSARARHHPSRPQTRQLPAHVRRRLEGGRFRRLGDVREGVGDADGQIGRLARLPSARALRRSARRRLRHGGGHLVHGRHPLLPSLRPDPL